MSMPIVRDEVVVAPTITVLPADPAGRVLFTGSHGGLYTGRLAAGLGTRGVVFHDAGIGLSGAGVAGIALLGGYGVPAAAMSAASCRIGDTDDMLERGRVSYVNAPAVGLGARVGMSAAEVLAVLGTAQPSAAVELEAVETRAELLPVTGGIRLVFVDSAASVKPTLDDGAIVVSGSHGGLIGGDAAKALKANAFAAVFNDAGIGIDRAGIGRLAALEARGIAALTVDAASARIGDAFSTFAGTVSAVNDVAADRGAVVGGQLSRLLLQWARSGSAQSTEP